MAIQLNKISRNLLQSRRLFANSVEFLHQSEAVAPADAAVKCLPNLMLDNVSRSYATKPKGGRPCKLSRCPRFFLEGCACPSPCAKKRRLPCKKRLAPYPSYSEACVEDLDEDPSECVQCPWKHCPSFTPKYRGYHTQLEGRAAPNTVQHVLQEVHLYEKKPPCKKPMGPCEHRRRYLEQLRKEKERQDCENSKHKRKCGDNAWTESVAQYYASKQEDQYPELDLKRRPPVDPCEDHSFSVFRYDPKEADYEHKRKRISQRTKCCPPKEAALDDINMQLESGYSKCPKRKPRYPDVDHTMNKDIRPPSCPRKVHDSTCCGIHKKTRKYKGKPQTDPVYTASLPQEPLLALESMDAGLLNTEMVLKKLPDCEKPPPCPGPCTSKPCCQRRWPWNYEHNKQRNRDNSKVRRRKRDMNQGFYGDTIIYPNAHRTHKDRH